jgi:glycerol-3-phosphate acyltransferase PlsX
MALEQEGTVGPTRRIAVDAMGGDAAPEVPVAGALAALAELPDRIRIALVGELDRVEAVLPPAARRRVDIVGAPETIGMDEAPALAVRRKRESSIVVGLQLVASGKADAFISAGSTGAVVAASVLELGMLPSVDRPAVGAIFPTTTAATLVLDVGANVGAKAFHLHQFARLGSVYIRDLQGLDQPRVGLLNVGEEAEKGGDVIAEAYALLESDPEIHFIGNVEGHRIIAGVCDVLVCDGFSGNVLLKFYESIAGFVVGLLRRPSGRFRRFGRVGQIVHVLDYAEYGGAPLLGVHGVTIVCHGGSPPRAIKNAIRVAVRSVESDMVRDMTTALTTLGETGM